MGEWIEYIIRRYGDDFKFPPYPKSFKIPDFVEAKWKYEENKIPILPIEQEIFELSVGDRFNAFVIQRRKATGYKGLYRIRQFEFEPNIKMKGYILYENSKSRKRTLKKGEVEAGIVCRCKIISIDHKRRIYNCVALAHTFNKDNLEGNLTYCFYEKHKK